uniref:Uncharacterized protein n=1 Tax=Bracon brevicornis TaxID=1563983 RepID=A0A6V7KRY4_9HYME
MCERPGPINIRCGCYDEVHELDPLILDNYSLEELQNQYHIVWKTARKQSGCGFEPDWPPAGYNVTYLKRNCDILSSLDLFIYNLKSCDELLLRILKEFTKTPDADTTMIGEIIEKHRTLIVEINEFHSPEDFDSEGPYRPITADYYTRGIIYDICDWKSAAVEVLIKKSKEFYEQLPRIELVKK